MSTISRTLSIRVGKFRILSILLAFTAASGLVFGTTGFTTMDADRGVEMGVAEDDKAYLGYDPLVNENEEITAGEPTATIEYHNRASVDFDTLIVDVSRAGTGSEPTVETFDAPGHLDRGSVGSVIVTLNCSTKQVVKLKFEVVGSGSAASVSLDRTLSVTCVPDQEEKEDKENEMDDKEGADSSETSN
ncbi:hypothetical protein [Halorubrum amylolyticum]|uniref:hypothetical protein n=1 Tax=Halorubrum amylolyticum TaxID=2508724 RepID=UPI001008CA7E|nr:hypothetical protein [Halorubrum amylolyticum]